MFAIVSMFLNLTTNDFFILHQGTSYTEQDPVAALEEYAEDGWELKSTHAYVVDDTVIQSFIFLLPSV